MAGVGSASVIQWEGAGNPVTRASGELMGSQSQRLSSDVTTAELSGVVGGSTFSQVGEDLELTLDGK